MRAAFGSAGPVPALVTGSLSDAEGFPEAVASAASLTTFAGRRATVVMLSA